MKKIIQLLILSAAVMGTAQSTTETYNGLTGWSETSNTSSNQNLQNQSVAPYDAVWIEGNFDVTLFAGKEGNIELSGSADILEDVTVEKTRKGLKISYPHTSKLNRKMKRSRPVKVRIPFNDLNAIHLSGSGSIKTDALIKANTLTTGLAGSGSIALEIEAKQSKAQLSGSGKITLTGESNQFESRLAGSGTINGKELTAQNTEASLTGSGRIHVQGREKLKTNISGSGTISVYEQTQSVQSNHVGSGRTKFIKP